MRRQASQKVKAAVAHCWSTLPFLGTSVAAPSLVGHATPLAAPRGPADDRAGVAGAGPRPPHPFVLLPPFPTLSTQPFADARRPGVVPVGVHHHGCVRHRLARSALHPVVPQVRSGLPGDDQFLPATDRHGAVRLVQVQGSQCGHKRGASWPPASKHRCTGVTRTRCPIFLLPPAPHCTYHVTRCSAPS